MSIHDEIKHRVSEGRLLPLRPLMSDVKARAIYLTPQVMNIVAGPWSDTSLEVRASRARAILDDFVSGGAVVGRMPPSKSVHTVIALLEPRKDEVWEFRIGEPKPGMRIFGRFATQDVFVGTCWGLREDFDTEKTWRDNGLVRAKTDWTNLFPAYQPHSGADIHDYISNSRLPV